MTVNDIALLVGLIIGWNVAMSKILLDLLDAALPEQLALLTDEQLDAARGDAREWPTDTQPLTVGIDMARPTDATALVPVGKWVGGVWSPLSEPLSESPLYNTPLPYFTPPFAYPAELAEPCWNCGHAGNGCCEFGADR